MRSQRSSRALRGPQESMHLTFDILFQDREDCMMLYGPRQMTVKKDVVQFYDIVVHSDKNPNHAYSLCRFTNKDEAKARFEHLRGFIPVLMLIDRDSCQVVCKFSRASWCG